MTIELITTVPSQDQPETFAADADLCLQQLRATVDSLNEVINYYNAATTTTSTSSVTAATGTLNFTIPTGLLGWNAGLPVKINDAANACQLDGQIVSYNSGTGALVVNISSFTGAGTYASWELSLGHPFLAKASKADAQNGLNNDDFMTPLRVMQAINSRGLVNKIINGAQEIDQINKGAAVTPTVSVPLTDMFGCTITQASKLRFQQVVDAPMGLKNSMRISVVSQYAPLAADQFSFRTAIEGRNVIDFSLGTSGAATFTTSFWVKGSVSGTYAVALRNAALNRCYVGTVAVTNAWSQLKITLQGDLTGTWATDNTIGLDIVIDLGSGADFNGSANAWNGGNKTRTSDAITFVNQSPGAFLNLTGFDCRLGDVAPNVYDRRFNESELAQRYSCEIDTQLNISASAVSSGAQTFLFYSLPVPMRVIPTILNAFWSSGVNASANTFRMADTQTVESSISSVSSGGYSAVANLRSFSARLF